MKDLTFVCDAAVLVDFPAIEVDMAIEEKAAFTLHVTDSPFDLCYAPTDTHWKLRTRTRGLWPAMHNATLTMHKETGLVDLSDEEAAAYLPYYFNLCRQLSAYAQAKGWTCGAAEVLKLEVEAGVLTAQPLAEEARPPLLCVRLDGQYAFDLSYWACVDDSHTLVQDLEVRAENGEMTAMRALAALYTYGGIETPKDATQLAKWNRALAEAGDETAARTLALQYIHGYGVTRNYEEAAHWYAVASATDEAEAARNHAKDMAQALNGDAHAQAELAAVLLLQAGKLDTETLDDDYAEAVGWAEKAADGGQGLGYWLLAQAYENGLGVNADLDRAVDYYRQGTAVGHIECQYGLASHYLNGEVLLPDLQRGFSLAKEAAQTGYLPAMRTIADCYLNGIGTLQDKEQALCWYQKVAEQINDPAVEEAIAYLKG